MRIPSVLHDTTVCNVSAARCTLSLFVYVLG